MWWSLLALAVVMGAGGYLLDVRWARRASLSLTRIGLGLAVIVAAMVLGGSLIAVHVERPPEQRGIGVRVEGLETPLRKRGFDPGLTLAMAVQVRGCGEPVRVQLTLAPTAEFWIDNVRRLTSPTTVRFAIPDDLSADEPEDAAVTALEAWASFDGLEPFTVPSHVGVGPKLQLEPVATKAPRATFVAVDVPDWAAFQRPVTIAFGADWTRPRTALGGCYVTLPAVAGLPTVLSTAQLAGETVESRSSLPDRTFNLFVVSSDEANLFAYYSEQFEVTRGVTSLDLGDLEMEEGSTLPSPNANLAGAPAWTCRSSIPSKYSVERLAPGTDAGDVYSPYDVIDRGGTVSFSASRQAEILAQSSCASFVAVEPASAGTRRDLLLIAVGTVIALGVELLISGFRRRPAGRGSV